MGGGLRQHLTRRTLIAGICAGLFLCFFALPMVAGAQAGEAAQLDLGVIEGTIYKLTTAIGGMFLWLGGSLLDIAIRQLVVGMGYWLNSSPMGATIDALWMVIRDIFNILFIFGLIYTGFKTILGLSGANTQKAVAMLIVAALFINFSLYFTKAIIDFSNVAAYQIYRMIDVHPEEAANGEVGGVTDAFLMYYGLTSYADPNAELLNQMSEESGWAPSGRVIAYAFMMMLFMLLAAFVFLASAILLITRFVALIIFMIFSPLMFLGLILPDFQQYMKKWWHSFLNYAFVAPAFLFMIYLSLRVLQGYNTQFGGGSFAQAFQADSGPTGMFSIFLNFFVITAFLWGSLLVAQKMGVAGASQMVKFGEGVTKNVRGGIQGFAGRNTIGRLGDAAQKYYDRKDAADGRTVRVLRSLGLDRSIRNVTEKGKNAKFGSSESRADVIKTTKESAARRAKIKPVLDLENAIKISDDAERAAAVEKTVRNMTQAQLEEAGEDILKNEEVMRYISSSQMEGIMKSNEFNDAEKADFAAKRATAIEGVLQKMAKANQTLVDVIGKASVAQLEALGVDKLKSNAVGLSTSQMDDLKKSKSLLESEFQAIAEARNAGLIRLFDDEGERDKLFRDRKDKDRAKLPKEILLRDEAVPYLTSETLKKILDNDELTADERTKMRENIAKNATGDHKEKLDNYFKTPHGSNF